MKAALETIKNKHMSNFANVKASAALTSIDTSRNTSLYKAEELIKADPKLMGRTVEKRRAKGRGIYIDNLPAYFAKRSVRPEGHFRGQVLAFGTPLGSRGSRIH